MIEFLFAHSGLVVLLAFVAAFVGIVLWICRPGSGAEMNAHARIPLKETDE